MEDEQPGGSDPTPISNPTLAPTSDPNTTSDSTLTSDLAPTPTPDPTTPPDPTPDPASNPTTTSDSTPNLDPAPTPNPDPTTTPDPIPNSDPTTTPSSTSDPTTLHLPMSVTQPFIEDPVHPPVAPVEKFAVDEVIAFAWKSMRKYFWPLTGILTCNFLVLTIPGVASMVLNYTSNSPAMSILGLVISLGSMVLNLIITLGIINLWLKVTDGDTIATRDVYAKIPKVWDFALATIAYGFMVGLGYICLILPGIYLQIRFQFYPYFIVDSNASPIQSLKASFAITKGAVAELLFLGIANYFIAWVGFMCFLIGTFPAQCIQNIGLARTYRLLRKNTPVSELPPNLLPVPLITDSDTPVIVQA